MNQVARSVLIIRKGSSARTNVQSTIMRTLTAMNVLHVTLNVEVVQEEVQKTVAYVETSNCTLPVNQFLIPQRSNVCLFAPQSFHIGCFLKTVTPIVPTFPAVQYMLDLKLLMTL